jgi:hypothetical protein
MKVGENSWHHKAIRLRDKVLPMGTMAGRLRIEEPQFRLYNST